MVERMILSYKKRYININRLVVWLVNVIIEVADK